MENQSKPLCELLYFMGCQNTITIHKRVNFDILYRFWGLFLLLTLSSCSLLNIESAQTPLDKVDLNTRILTQNYAKEALNRVEYAADSIILLEPNNFDIQVNALQWKIKTSRELGRLSFQTEPKIALLDTWSYALEMKYALESEHMKDFFGKHMSIAENANNENIEDIVSIASHMLSPKEFSNTKAFVEEYAKATPLYNQSKFRHNSIREAYLDYKKIPDSLAYQTVGTLSEVVADASNRLSYLSDATSKRLTWQSQIMLKENGIDSLNIQEKLAEIDAQFERLIAVAENAPENLEEAIVEFRNNMSPIFEDLNDEIRNSMVDISKNIDKLDDILLRERENLDSIIKREREALTLKAGEFVETGIEKTFEGIRDVVRSVIIYLILFLLVLFGIPFYLGYIIGKKKSKQ